MAVLFQIAVNMPECRVTMKLRFLEHDFCVYRVRLSHVDVIDTQTSQVTPLLYLTARAFVKHVRARAVMDVFKEELQSWPPSLLLEASSTGSNSPGTDIYSPENVLAKFRVAVVCTAAHAAAMLKGKFCAEFNTSKGRIIAIDDKLYALDLIHKLPGEYAPLVLTLDLHRPLTPHYSSLQGFDGYVVLYNVVDRGTFEKVVPILEELDVPRSSLPLVVVCSKIGAANIPNVQNRPYFSLVYDLHV